MASSLWCRPIFNDGGVTVSSGNDKYSNPIGIGKTTALSIHLVWTVVSSGTVTTTVWTSNKERPSTTDDTDWVQETGITVSGPAGSNSKSMTHISNVNSRWLRLKFAYASGTSAFLLGYAHGKD